MGTSSSKKNVQVAPVIANQVIVKSMAKHAHDSDTDMAELTEKPGMRRQQTAIQTSTGVSTCSNPSCQKRIESLNRELKEATKLCETFQTVAEQAMTFNSRLHEESQNKFLELAGRGHDLYNDVKTIESEAA